MKIMTTQYTNTRKTIQHAGKEYRYYSLPELAESLQTDLLRLPYSIRILLESCLRNYLEKDFSGDAIPVLANWNFSGGKQNTPVPFLPARILLQDFTGLPVLNDLTALRAAVQRKGKDPGIINPRIPVDMTIDHSVQVQEYGCEAALEINEEREFNQNYERYRFLKWSESAYDNLSILPPGLGICHQVNLEYFGKVVFSQEDENGWVI